MSTVLPAAFAFSVVATFAVLLVGRRDAFGTDRLSAAALLLLVALPFLSLLPGWTVLPASEQARPGAPAFFVAWLLPAGMTVGLVRLLCATRRLRHLIGKSRPVDQCLTPKGRRIEIRMLDEITSPCAAGVIRPVVLVPPHWSALQPAHRKMVLAHEIAHHHRRDPLWRLLGVLACALHWFNPLVWWLARHHAYQAELACDAAVLATGARPDRYAHLLCDLAQTRATPLVAAMAGSTLGRRMERLHQPRPRLTRAWLIAHLLLLVITGLAFGLSRPARPPVSSSEVHLRLTAEPFPGNR
ncbi:M56 family metallopeptidase [Haloferula sp. A504]|uniref:M56 family metallopeptidase n=1 Tax=Haloferula sp. A504 TaxID=3373601 RepID=UPI0031BBF560|nr:M56 family metallopeptidase [Verrucomicrobiaceae bacterium E54]